MLDPCRGGWSRRLSPVLAVAMLGASAAAQCAPQWGPSPVGATNGVIWESAVHANGDVFVSGAFTIIDGVAANHVARWDGTTWVPLGPGVGTQNAGALAVLPGGDLIAVSGVGGTIQRWDGASWSMFAPGGNLSGYATLVVAANGDVLTGGFFTSPASYIARWTGATWVSLGSGLTGGTSGGAGVEAILEMPNGDLIAGGAFTSAGVMSVNNIARWNGSAWSSLGNGLPGIVRALVRMPNGDVVAGGHFFGLGGVNDTPAARWDGAAWTPVGTCGIGDTVFALHLLPDGDLVAGGVLSSLGNNLARWDGVSWTILAGGVDSGFTGSLTHSVRTLAWRDGGELFVGGWFTAAGGQPASNVARLAAACPATAVSAGAGCGSALTATSLPWLGGTFRAQGSGLPALALVSIVTGFTPWSLPLAAILPQGVPGCDLLVAPDFVDFAVTTTGSVSTAIAIPATAALVGLAFWQQLNPFEIDASLNIVAVTASNSLRMTIGSF